MQPMIEVNAVTKSIKQKDILKQIDFTIYQGECVALIGPNGAGKTTLMSCLLGDKYPTKGNIQLASLPATALQLKEKVAVLPQENTIPERLKVKELIQFYQSIYAQHLTIEEIDALLQFSDVQKEQFADKLSGGQRRLLSFVLVLIGKPSILLLDEPTTGMDTSTRVRFWEIVHELKEKGLTIVYSSHYIEEVEHTADRIIVLHQGELLRDTTPHAMKNEEIEKHFTIPIRYQAVVESLVEVEQLVTQKDHISFMTKQPEIVWQVLEKHGCSICEIEIQNRTLLDSIFETTKEEN